MTGAPWSWTTQQALDEIPGFPARAVHPGLKPKLWGQENVDRTTPLQGNVRLQHVGESLSPQTTQATPFTRSCKQGF